MDSDTSPTFLLIFTGVKSPKLGLDFQPPALLIESVAFTNGACL